jgi:hypothetical protein
MERFKICLSCTSTPVDGCDNLTQEETMDWLALHQETLVEPNECGDTTKYVILAIEPVE